MAGIPSHKHLYLYLLFHRVVGWGMLLELLTWDRHHSKHLISANTFNLQTHLITMKYVLLLFLTNSEVMEVMRSSRLAQGLHLVIWIYIIRSLPGAHVNSVMNHLMILVFYVLICLPSQTWYFFFLSDSKFLLVWDVSQPIFSAHPIFSLGMLMIQLLVDLVALGITPSLGVDFS